MTTDRIFSVDKAKKDFGFKQKVSLDEGIKETYIWYKKYGFVKPYSAFVLQDLYFL